jgi:hypothetical protein
VNGGMSAIGTKRTSDSALHMSAFEGKADRPIALHMSANDPKREQLRLLRNRRSVVCHFLLAARSQSARLFSRGLPSTRFAQLNGAVIPTDGGLFGEG